MRLCTVTGSRADWGLLRPVLSRLRNTPIDSRIIVTGSHLDTRFGDTANTIEQDGFVINKRVPLNLKKDDILGVSKAMAQAVSGIAKALDELHPDLMLILGDRYEIFAAAQAALIARIPIAHIAGGDISEGAYDDAIRHAITKLSHLHFTTNAEARRRVMQLGESDERVFNTGSPGIDALHETPRWSQKQLEQRLNFKLLSRNLAITFHPATLDPAVPEKQIAPLLDALDGLSSDVGLVFTGANADDGGQTINRVIEDFADRHDNACYTVSLGQAGYYSLVEQADLVVGNSSSGLYEAPSLRTPTLDIGIRQQGRLCGPSVSHVKNDSDAIHERITTLLQQPPNDFTNPYGDGKASQRIGYVLLAIDDPAKLLIKHFVDVGA